MPSDMSSLYGDILAAAVGGLAPDAQSALALSDCDDLDALTSTAAAIRDMHRGNLVGYSRKVFIPLTHLCRNACGYCTFAQHPDGTAAFLEPDEVIAIAEAGRRAGCKEALFTLGDKPELKHPEARAALARLGYASTIDYVEAMARRVMEETGLLPHLNPGVMTSEEIGRLRSCAASMGLMLESSAPRLLRRGQAHFGAPDKLPAARLATIASAGALAVPFTSGILIGIGETRRERIEALLDLRSQHERHGHLQEVIVQNFRAKPGTAMASAQEPSFDEHRWTVAVARILFGPEVSIQAPPNLAAGPLAGLIAAGIDDWGGVSPVTPDHVNPEAPWPHLAKLAAETAAAGKLLVERLAIHPRYVLDADRWIENDVRPLVLRHADAAGYARPDNWAPGLAVALPLVEPPPHPRATAGNAVSARIDRAIDLASNGVELSEDDIVALFAARGADFHRVCAAADALRREVCGNRVGYVVNRNITYTNVCSFKCQFCAFSKDPLSKNLRGRPYDFDLSEIARRAREAQALGATEVCIQGGIHPSYTGQHYLDILAAVKTAVPDIHVHAFSPLEIQRGAASLGMDLRSFLRELQQAGLGSLPGTAAEILDDDVRRVLCPDKLTTSEWQEVVETAHEIGLRSTATIMFGHMEQPMHWARHLLLLRRLQARTGGFTEFVPLAFIAPEAPLFLKGRARLGPTLRESVLMYAVARLVLHPLIPNVQGSWVKLGRDGIALALNAGANDFGGTLMDESISRSAGGAHGQGMTSAQIETAIRSLGRDPWQRTTLYGDAAPALRVAA